MVGVDCRRSTKEVGMMTGFSFPFPWVYHVVAELVLLHAQRCPQLVADVTQEGYDVGAEGLHVHSHDYGDDTFR